MNNDSDYEEYFEEWEGHYYYRSREDYDGLIQYCEKIVKKRPNDLHAKNYLGEAYILNKNYKKALEYLSPINKRNPDIDAFKYLILDALYGLGKNENDYKWIKKPNIIDLNDKVIDKCYKYLKPKRKPRSINELYMLFMLDGYMRFNELELLKKIKSDPRFIVRDDEIYINRSFKPKV